MSESPRSRFRLQHWRWFLMATVVLAVAGIGLSIWLPYHSEQQAIQRIKNWDGVVETATFSPGWLRQLVGIKRVQESKVFERVISVDCRLPSWRGNRPRRRNRTLSVVVPVTDSGLAQLSGLRNTEQLYLEGTQVTDSGLAHLSGLTNLQRLCLSGTGVNGIGLDYLRGLPRLTFLWLDRTPVTDAGLAHLNGLPEIEFLSLVKTQITDAGLKELKELRNLKILYLFYTALTDDGLAYLSGFTNLRELYISGTAVTNKGIQDIKNALPDCKVYY